MRRTTAPRIEFIEFLSRKLCAPSERAASQRCVRRFLNAISIACSIQRPGFKDVNLPNAPIGSPEFCAAYFAALRGENVAQVASIAATSAGSVNAVVAQFFEKADSFKVLKPSTQSLRRALLNKFCEAHGDKPFAQIDRDYIDRLFDAMTSPIVRRTLLLALRPLMEFAVKEKLIKTDPTAGIKIKLPKSDGHHTTTEEEIAQYKAHHAFGTKARLGLELGLQQGMRRSDVIRVGPPHLKDGEITIKHYKTGMPVTLTVSPDLAKAIAMCSTIGVQTFLTRDNGRPYDEKRYNTDFRKWCNEAGLPEHCVPHGLRKSFTCRLMEAVATMETVQCGSARIVVWVNANDPTNNYYGVTGDPFKGTRVRNLVINFTAGETFLNGKPCTIVQLGSLP